jgi:hypothetical protein
MRQPRSRLLRWAVALFVPLAAASCTSPASEPRPTRPSGVEGTIFAIPDTGSSSPVVAFRLPTETVAPVPAGRSIPTSTYTVSHASGPDPAGGVDLLVTDEQQRASVYRVTPAGEATRVGPPLRTGKPDPYFSLSVAGGMAVVASCSRISVLSFSDPREWKPVATGCWAGLSSDGSSLVYSPDGAEIETLRLPDGRPTKLLDTSRLRGIFPPGFPGPTLVGPPAWSENGLAFTIRSGGEVAIVVRRPSGSVVPVFREPLVSTSQLPRISWQPGGNLLAIADDMGPSGGVLRLWDPESDHLRAIGLDLLGFSAPQWSPDGSSLASLTSAKSLIVFDPGGAWRLRVETTWEDLLAWGG